MSVSDLQLLRGSGASCSGAGGPWEQVKHEALLVEPLYREREGPELRRLAEARREAVDVAGVRGCDGT